MSQLLHGRAGHYALLLAVTALLTLPGLGAHSLWDIDDGVLLRLQLTGNRRAIAVDDPRLEDRVADNPTFHDLTESESLVFGTGFGVVTDIETGPDGHLYVVSLSAGAVYEVGRR